MQILAVLASDLLSTLRTSVGAQVSVYQTTASAVEARLGDPEAKLVVIDPAQLRPEAFASVVQRVASCQNTAILIYTHLTPPTARAALRASEIMPVEVLFSGAHDERDALATLCARSLAASAQAFVLSGLARNLERVGDQLCARTVGLFGGREIPGSVTELLSGLEEPPDTVRRRLIAAGIPRIRRLRLCALLVQAYPELKNDRRSVEEIVYRLRAGSIRAFRRACLELVGCSARKAAQLDEREFAKRLIRATSRDE
jgi:hypothetical protein